MSSLPTLPQPPPGPQRPVPATAPRAPSSVRRTTSIDVTRPEGPTGPAVVLLRGRDVATDADGRPSVLASWSVQVPVEPAAGTVLGFSATSPDGPTAAAVPEVADLDPLVGASLRSGFGRRVAALLPHEADARSLRHALLEDLAGGFLVSGYAPLRAGLLAGPVEAAKQRAPLQADICVGWATGGAIHRQLADHGHTAVPVGPEAPAIERDDPAGWHPLPPLAEGTVRRRRLLDVTAIGDGRMAAHSHFRDTYAPEDGEMVMHEYAVDATIADDRIEEVVVDARVLPWKACPGAVASARRIVGVGLDDLARTARTELVGPSTCTHLTSTIRLLADVRALAPLVADLVRTRPQRAW